MDNELLYDIGKRIAEIRQAHKMTQAELSEKLGVSPKHISHTECGTSMLSLKNLIEFCNLFHCSLDYLVFGKQENSVLSKLPDEVANLICTGTEKDIDLLNRYLQFYVELLKKQD